MKCSKHKNFRWMFLCAAKPPKARSRQSRRLAEAIDEYYAKVERSAKLGKGIVGDGALDVP